MQKHIDQANHNIEFHSCIDSKFTGKFTDWKITVLFYVAIHLIKALAAKDKKNIGNSHKEINTGINPTNRNAVMKISRKAWRSYQTMYQNSKNSRYNGITDLETFEELLQGDYQSSLENLVFLTKYLNGRGIKSQPVQQAQKHKK
jgi:predicted acetyltransferase